MTRLAAIVTSLLLLPSFASADDDPTELRDTDDWGARSRISLSIGRSSPSLLPVTDLGVEYTQVFHPHLEAGFGMAVTSGGPSATLMPRVRTGQGPFSVTLGAGLTAGTYTPDVVCDEVGGCRTFSVLWLSAEIGLQVTSKHGALFRVFAGEQSLLAHDACWKGDMDCAALSGSSSPYGGVAIGQAF